MNFRFYQVRPGLIVAIDANIPKSFHQKLVRGWIEEHQE